MRNNFDRAIARAGGVTFTLAAATVLLVAMGCNNVLGVDLPGRIPSQLLEDPSTASTLAASVTADFECAFSNYINSTVTLSDQFLGASGNLTAKNWGTRKISEEDTSNEQTACTGSYGAYTPLQTARFQSDDILKRLTAWSDADAKIPLAPLRARVATIGAYAYTVLGEGFCSMRFSEEKQIHTPQEVLAVAETKFTAALTLIGAMAAGDARTELQNLAYVGRARVRLDRGNKNGAAADAALVASGFEFFVSRSVDAQTRWNDAWYAMAELGNSSVDPAYRHLTVGGVPDPRVQVSAGPAVGLPALSFDGVTDLYVVTNKNFSRGDPMRLASYIEAQLIIAEANLGTTATQIINTRRAQLGLPAYSGPTDDASVLALVLDERNREFFMEGGQRYNDLLRYHIPWKVGNDQNGIPYGTTTCMPLPKSESIAAGG